jgi:tetratricopeptide (TPR) repeat protein
VPRRYTLVSLLAVATIAWLTAVAVEAASSDSDRAIALAQRRIRRNPGNPIAYYQLGDAYVRKARESGDPTYFGLADQALRESLKLDPGQSGVVRHLAYVLYMRHEFADAAAHASKAIGLDPGDSDAHGVLGDAYLETGKYELADRAYRTMIQIKRDLSSYSRLSGLKSLKGDPRGAIEDLERAIEIGQADGSPAEAIAWAQWQLGNEHLALGDLAKAEARYLASMQTYANYHRALAGLGQVRAAQGRYDAAIELYQKAIAIIPQPDYVVALGDVYTKIGRHEDARRQYALVEYIGRLNALNRVLYNRELALFYADHDTKLTEALDLARRELAVRQDIYAYDVLAWSLYKNGEPGGAREAMTEALKLGTRDARLFFHAGMIHLRLGDSEQARAYLRRALETNPHFHVLHAGLARRTLAVLEGGASRTATPETLHDR